MRTTSFIAIETCPSEPYYPVACAWSLATGEVKSSLIQPPANWPQDACYGDNLEFTTLLTQGHTLKDIMLEINNDLDGQWVLCHSDFPIGQSFNHIANEFDLYPSFEWSDSSDNLATAMGEQWREDIDGQARQLEKDINQAEDCVKIMQLCWSRYHFPDTDWVLQFDT